MAIKLRPVTIDDIAFDALLEYDEGFSADIPQYPTEKGFSVGDNISLKPRTLSLTLFVSDTPVTWRKKRETRYGYSESVVSRLRDLFAERKLVTVTLPHAYYKNMAITTMSVKRSTEIGFAREITVELQRVRVTTRKNVKIPASYGKSGKSKSENGRASTKGNSKGSSSSKSKSKSNSSGGGGSGSGSSKKDKSGSVLYNTANSFGLL